MSGLKKANKLAAAFEKGMKSPSKKSKAPPTEASDTCTNCGQPMPAETAADLKASDSG